MDIIKKKLNENELINEQYSLLFNKIIENYHVVKDFDNCIEWIIKDIKDKFLKDIDNINDEDVYFTGYYWTITERKCSTEKIDKTSCPIYYKFYFSDLDDYAYVEERNFNSENAYKVIVYINAYRLVNVFLDYELQLSLEHEFSHVRTGYARCDVDDRNTTKNIDTYIKNDPLVKNMMKSTNKFLNRPDYERKILILFKCMSETEQQARISSFGTFVKKYIEDFNSKKHLLSLNTRFDDIIEKGDKYTNWILFRDVIQELHFDIIYERYEFLLCLCCLLNDAKLIKSEPFINRKELSVYINKRTHEQLLENTLVKKAIRSMYKQIYNNLLEYQHSLNRQIYAMMMEMNAYKNRTITIDNGVTKVDNRPIDNPINNIY